jgi:DNA polymerase III epsilon subunit family exonuclease
MPTRRFVAIDLETAGLDPEVSPVIEVGMAAFTREGVIERFKTLVNPGQEVPYAVLALTGIEASELEQAPKFGEVAGKISEFIGDSAIVGQSVGFDLGFLAKAGIKPTGPVLDTWDLASIFLPGLPAYRLESIAEAVGVELPDAHRALPDAEASAEVLLKILEIAENSLSPELGKEVGDILDRSDYGLKEVWDELSFHGNNKLEVANPVRTKLPGTTTGVVEFIQGLLRDPAEHILGVLPPETSIASALTEALKGNKQDRLCVAFTSYQQVLQAQDLLPGIVSFFAADHYLSEARAKKYLGEPRFSSSETVMALRLRLFLEWGEAGSRDEIALFGSHYGLWDTLSCAGLSEAELAEERYYVRAKDQAKNASVCLTDHRSLANIELSGVLVIADSQLLDENLTLAKTVRIDQRDGEGLSEAVRSDFDLVVGLLGIVLEQFASSGLTERVARLRPPILRTKQWQQFVSSAERFAALPVPKEATFLEGEQQKSLQTRLMKILEHMEGDIVWVKEWGGSLSLHAAPMSPKKIMSSIGDGRRVIMLGKASGESPADYQVSTYNTEGLRPTAEVVQIGEANDRDWQIELIAKLAKEEGRMAVFCSSNALAKDMFEPLSKALSREVVGSGASGSRNRLVSLIETDPSRVLLAGPGLWNAHELESVFDVVIVPKISFDIPTDPLHEARGEISGGFVGYSLPRATARMRALVGKLKPSGRLIILDPRLHSQRYGATLLEKLGVPVVKRRSDDY